MSEGTPVSLKELARLCGGRVSHKAFWNWIRAGEDCPLGRAISAEKIRGEWHVHAHEVQPILDFIASLAHPGMVHVAEVAKRCGVDRETATAWCRTRYCPRVEEFTPERLTILDRLGRVVPDVWHVPEEQVVAMEIAGLIPSDRLLAAEFAELIGKHEKSVVGWLNAAAPEGDDAGHSLEGWCPVLGRGLDAQRAYVRLRDDDDDRDDEDRNGNGWAWVWLVHEDEVEAFRTALASPRPTGNAEQYRPTADGLMADGAEWIPLPAFADASGYSEFTLRNYRQHRTPVPALGGEPFTSCLRPGRSRSGHFRRELIHFHADDLRAIRRARELEGLLPVSVYARRIGKDRKVVGNWIHDEWCPVLERALEVERRLGPDAKGTVAQDRLYVRESEVDAYLAAEKAKLAETVPTAALTPKQLERYGRVLQAVESVGRNAAPSEVFDWLAKRKHSVHRRDGYAVLRCMKRQGLYDGLAEREPTTSDVEGVSLDDFTAIMRAADELEAHRKKATHRAVRERSETGNDAVAAVLKHRRRQKRS